MDVRCPSPNCKRLLLKMDWGRGSIKCRHCKRVWSFEIPGTFQSGPAVADANIARN